MYAKYIKYTTRISRSPRTSYTKFHHVTLVTILHHIIQYF